MTGPARIIDANANRAREALRVLEDAARFGLDAPDLCAPAKELRHELGAALAGLGIDETLLLSARDTPGDVGTGIATEGEGSRRGLRQVAVAAGHRLSESLRSIEEAVKALPDDARPIEALRYRAYDVSQRIVLAFGTGRARQWRVCALITESLCARHPWDRVAELAVEGGADCVQLREKGLSDRELLGRARRLVRIARQERSSQTAVIINDRVDIALLADADGVHLGQEDLDVPGARRLAGDRLLVGVSTASMAQARSAAEAGADYCGCGPMFESATKRKASLSGAAYLRAYLGDPATARVPHLAISGITPDNVGELREAGCRGVAVSAAVCGAENPARVVAELAEALDRDGVERPA